MAEFREEAGLDIGATLAKAVVVAAGAALDDPEHFRDASSARAATWPRLPPFCEPHPDASLAATGAGAGRLRTSSSRRRRSRSRTSSRPGARASASSSRAPTSSRRRPTCLVSLGTGTSILRVGQEGRVARAGGTGLGGGTLRGFGQLLLGQIDHDALTALAGQGDRRRIDLLVRDLYQSGEIALQGNLTASNLGRVSSRDSRDIAHAITGLVGENVALLAAALSKQEAAPGPLDIVYAGSTLIRNVALRDVLAFATSVGGARARFLPHGEFVGAVGALVRARKRREGAPT